MKAVVLFSGGLDSSTCLAMAVEKYGEENVIALSLIYGQKHERELRSADEVARYYRVCRKTVDVGEIFDGSNCSLLKTSGAEIPEESYAEQIDKAGGKPVSTYVPYRNGLFLSIAASIALINNCGEVWYGAHADDAAGNAYPDCSEKFNDYIKKAIYEGTGGGVAVVAPFIGKPKADIVAEGLRLKVPYELTWSCYEGGEKPCGVCGTCRDRKKAFEANGREDPLCK